MFDHITVAGVIKPIDPVDWNRFEQVAFLQRNDVNFRPTVCYRQSPLTGAQFSVTPSSRKYKNGEYLQLTFKIPVNAVLNGANIIPGDHWACVRTLKAIGKFLRWFLHSAGFTPAEVDYFMAHSRIVSAELTWHIACSSHRGAKLAQLRLFNHLKALKRVQSQAYKIKKIRHYGDDENFSFYADVVGAQLKSYLKSEQAKSRDRKNRQKNFLSDEMRPHSATMLKEVESHVRLEVVLESEMLRKHGLELPLDWTADRVVAAIEDVWEMMGLSIPFVSSKDHVPTAGLHPKVQSTLARYFAGEDPKHFLAGSARTRHGAILRERGLEIGTPWTKHRQAISGTIGKQLQYSKHHVFPEAIVRLGLSPEKLDRLIERLNKECQAHIDAFSQDIYDMRRRESIQRMVLLGRREQYASDWMAPEKKPRP